MFQVLPGSERMEPYLTARALPAKQAMNKAKPAAVLKAMVCARCFRAIKLLFTDCSVYRGYIYADNAIDNTD